MDVGKAEPEDVYVGLELEPGERAFLGLLGLDVFLDCRYFRAFLAQNSPFWVMPLGYRSGTLLVQRSSGVRTQAASEAPAAPG